MNKKRIENVNFRKE